MSSSKPQSVSGKSGVGSKPKKQGDSREMHSQVGLNSTTRMPHNSANAYSACTASGLRPKYEVMTSGFSAAINSRAICSVASKGKVPMDTAP